MNKNISLFGPVYDTFESFDTLSAKSVNRLAIPSGEKFSLTVMGQEESGLLIEFLVPGWLISYSAASFSLSFKIHA